MSRPLAFLASSFDRRQQEDDAAVLTSIAHEVWASPHAFDPVSAQTDQLRIRPDKRTRSHSPGQLVSLFEGTQLPHWSDPFRLLRWSLTAVRRASPVQPNIQYTDFDAAVRRTYAAMLLVLLGVRFLGIALPCGVVFVQLGAAMATDVFCAPGSPYDTGGINVPDHDALFGTIAALPPQLILPAASAALLAASLASLIAAVGIVCSTRRAFRQLSTRPHATGWPADCILYGIGWVVPLLLVPCSIEVFCAHTGLALALACSSLATTVAGVLCAGMLSRTSLVVELAQLRCLSGELPDAQLEHVIGHVRGTLADLLRKNAADRDRLLLFATSSGEIVVRTALHLLAATGETGRSGPPDIRIVRICPVASNRYVSSVCSALVAWMKRVDSSPVLIASAAGSPQRSRLAPSDRPVAVGETTTGSSDYTSQTGVLGGLGREPQIDLRVLLAPRRNAVSRCYADVATLRFTDAQSDSQSPQQALADGCCQYAVKTHMISVVAKSVPKIGFRAVENEDAFAVTVTPSADVRIAVADGVTQSFSSRTWAQLLVDAFASEPFWTPSNVAQRAQQMSDVWSKSFDVENLDFTDIEKFIAGGAACLLGLTLFRANADRCVWHALGVGDVCLFIVRDGELILSFPYRQSSSFSSLPPHISTRSESNTVVQLQAVEAQGTCCRGDSLVIATDALAAWCITENEAGRAPWRNLKRQLEQDDVDRAFVNFVNQTRSSGRMNDDDVTAVLVTIDDA